MWHCESGCKELVSGNYSFSDDNAYWQNKQGIPAKLVGEVMTILCTDCANLEDEWTRGAGHWGEYLQILAMKARLDADVERGVEGAEKALVDYYTNVDDAYIKKAKPLVLKWLADRKASVKAINDERSAKAKAEKEAKKAKV